MLQRQLLRGLASTQTVRPSAIAIGAHVRQALANGCPVVALESTVITHGLPEPQNLQLALQLEREIRDGLWWLEGADSPMRGVVTPATIGVIKGQLVVGLSGEQLEYLANSGLSRPLKASRRDLPVIQALGLSAGTTVSATMAIATSCWPSRPISVFATGGLGGVHQGGELSMDVSADLFEMSQTPMGLVSSGFKSFLDTRRSLELLETLGCTVVSLRPSERTYSATCRMEQRKVARQDSEEQGRGHLFPGFFTTTCKEGATSPWQCADIQEAARILHHCLSGASSSSSSWIDSGKHEEGHLRGSRAMLIACPIPAEYALDQTADQLGDDGASYSRELLDEICAQVERRPDLSGSERTPFILAELNRVTGGKTLAANLELLRNNARVGAHLAFEHSKLASGFGGGGGGGGGGGSLLAPGGLGEFSSTELVGRGTPDDFSGIS